MLTLGFASRSHFVVVVCKQKHNTACSILSPLNQWDLISLILEYLETVEEELLLEALYRFEDRVALHSFREWESDQLANQILVATSWVEVAKMYNAFV